MGKIRSDIQLAPIIKSMSYSKSFASFSNSKYKTIQVTGRRRNGTFTYLKSFPLPNAFVNIEVYITAAPCKGQFLIMTITT